MLTITSVVWRWGGGCWQAGSYDFARTVSSPGTPVFDTEWHPFSTVKWRDTAMPAQYVEANFMLGALHG
jgi:hypothetical protein